MTVRRFLVLTAAMFVLAQCLSFAQGRAPGSLRAGAAKVDVTPPQSDLKIATDSIRDHLFVRAIAVDDGSACAVLVGVDGGAPDNLMSDILPRASAATGCPAENIIVGGTHSHSTMPGGGPAGAPATSKRWADAIVQAMQTAKSRLAPARIGYATANVDLNVNRDMFNSKLEWRQEPNADGISDKTLAVVEFLGADDVPIGVFMNYAMHPINFYLSGVISADFPGEASRYIEELFGDRTVAVFTQGASGDQNPRMAAAPFHILVSRNYFLRGKDIIPTVGPPPPPPVAPAATGFNPAMAASERAAIPPETIAAYKKTVARTGEYVVMLGTTLAIKAVQLMRDSMQPVATARIWGAADSIVCPGRNRTDRDNPIRENGLPGYQDGPDVKIGVGLVRIGDLDFVPVTGEVYSEIALRLKKEAPAAKTIMVTNVSPRANSGYIYSDDSAYHLSFQVIGSRLKPGCAEGKIVSKAIELMHRSGQ